MIEFRELRITNDSKYLIIDAAIKEDSYFENMRIQEVNVDLINEDLTLKNSIYSKTDIPSLLGDTSGYVEDDEITVQLEDGSILTSNILYNHIRLVIPQNTINEHNLAKGLFVVHVVTEGDIPSEMPVGYANKDIKGIVVNMYPFYRNYIKKIQRFNTECGISNDLISDIIEMKTLEISVKLGDEIAAAKYWYLFNKVKCNCYGRT